MRSEKILIRLREWSGWSEYSLGPHVEGTLSDVAILSFSGWTQYTKTARVVCLRQYSRSRLYASRTAIYTTNNNDLYVYTLIPRRRAKGYSEPSLQRQYLFRRRLLLKWICCCKEYLISKLICKKGFVLLLFPRKHMFWIFVRIA